MRCMKCDRARRGEFCFKCGEKLREPTDGERLIAYLEKNRKMNHARNNPKAEAQLQCWVDLVARLLARYHADTQVLKAEKPKSKDA